ncbi:Hypothetical protein NTJ_06709 [Nesidiocoris tenuis]|uniref:Uncharacterized protein n=1 Tax=Nesidiocoris tenuis TaxID=355587 RepID=A0ABN7ARI6_9HEMI|nr:Hypothetical protein NTJ_06709 [Nesidiocoris tenuis]
MLCRYQIERDAGRAVDSRPYTRQDVAFKRRTSEQAPKRIIVYFLRFFRTGLRLKHLGCTWTRFLSRSGSERDRKCVNYWDGFPISFQEPHATRSALPAV